MQPPRRLNARRTPATPIKGFPVRLMFEMEAPVIGCGHRLVTVQFRTRKKKKVEKLVVLHCAGYTATIRREVFKELVASNKRYRNKPTLRLVVSNPRTVSRLLDQEAAA